MIFQPDMSWDELKALTATISSPSSAEQSRLRMNTVDWAVATPPKSDATRSAAAPEATNSAADSQSRISLLLTLPQLLAGS
jgi:hypothetical protein